MKERSGVHEPNFYSMRLAFANLRFGGGRTCWIGGTPDVRQHLENLGFNIGGEVVVVNTLGENIIVKVKECRIAVSDELARKIMV